VEEAERAAAELGYPLVMKAASPRLQHKTELGLVKVGVGNVDELRNWFSTLRQQALVLLGGDETGLEGILVQELAQPGVELIIGARQTEFGPIVLLGAGGVLTELVQDVSIRLAPVSHVEAQDMLDETRVGRLLGGFRGGPALDRAGVAAAVAGVSRLMAELSGSIAELDVNPLIVSEHGVLAVDALVRGSGLMAS
jgi:acetyltransferase